MKQKIFLFSLISFFVFAFTGCDSVFNEDVMYGTVGSKLEKNPPAEVSQVNVGVGNCNVELSWVNPTDKDLYGIKISVTSEEVGVAIPDPVSLSASTPESIPSNYTFYNLTNGKQYTFNIQAYDKNLNYSAGKGYNAIPTNSREVDEFEKFTAISGDGCITLSWEFKAEQNNSDIIGVAVTCNEKDDRSTLQTLQLPKSSSTKHIPTSYTFNNLTNGKVYEVAAWQYDSNGSTSKTMGSQQTPNKGINTMEASITNAIYGDGSMTLKWTNPVDENFYGIQITAEVQESDSVKKGSLETPVYFMKKDSQNIPTSYLATGLENNVSYKFIIKTLDRDLNLSSGTSSTAKPNPTSNKNDVQNFRAIPGNGYVDLFWSDPDDKSLLTKYYIMIYPGSRMVELSDISQTVYRVTGLDNGSPYSFTLITEDISENKSKGVSAEAIPDSGSSGILDHPDLFFYKNAVYAYDFGYCEMPIEKSFKFSSSSQIDFSKNVLKTVMGKSGVYTVVKAENITDGAEDISKVKPGDEFEIVVKYTPSKYNGTEATASWDETDFLIGGVKDNTIRLLGSNFPQPKSISSKNNELRIWLRSDLINKEKDCTDTGLVKKLPDYSGHGFDASCLDTTYAKAPRYIESDNEFNDLPVVDWSQNTTSQLISAASPIVQGNKGSTTFIVYKLDNITVEQSIITSNYGTGYPVLRASSKNYNDRSYYDGSDSKYSLQIRGQGMAGTYRIPCISNDENEIDNRMLVTGSSITATGISQNDNVGAKVLSTCMTFDATLSAKKVYTGRIEGYPYDFPSNIRMYVNGDERLLAYFDSLSSTTHDINNTQNSDRLRQLALQEEDYLFRNDGLWNYGVYGRPWGDGKGHRHISLGDTPKTQKVTDDKYEAWKLACQTGGQERLNYSLTYAAENWIKNPRKYTRFHDTAMNYNPPAANSSAQQSGTVHKSDYNSYSDYFENWIENSQWNRTITSLTLGAMPNVNNVFYGRIAEVFIFEGCLTDEEIDAMNNYIKYRYNIIPISTNVADYEYDIIVK